MPRRVQDIIPAGRRSIRDIPVKEEQPSRGSSRPSPRAMPKDEMKERGKDIEPVKINREHAVRDGSSKETSEPVVSEKPKRKKKRHVFPWALSVIGVVVVLAGVGFFASGHFARATFTLVPKVVPVKVGGTYIIPNASSGAFGYELMTVTGSASTTVPAALGSYTETKAQGSVTVYNAYSTQSQKLVAGTRLAAKSGLIYRLTSSIVVPGYTKSGSTVMPGSIKASVIADKAGAEYNISRNDTISDFKFIAYKGTSKYDAFYARLASDISGGFAGKKTVVSPMVVASTTAQMQQNIAVDLQRKLLNSIPDGYIMYQDAYVTLFDKPVVASVSGSSSASTQVSLSATAYGIMLKRNSFARFLAGASSTNVFGQIGYTAPDLESLSFAITNQKDYSPIKKGNIIARINGSFELVGAVPTDSLKDAVAGISLSQTRDILKKYASVIDLSQSAGEINPPWVGSVPTDKNRISIVVKDPR